MYTIGIDLGGTNIVAGLCDVDLKILKVLKLKTHKKHPPKSITEDMARLARELMESYSLSESQIECIGIATPGIVNTESGTVEFSCNLPFKNFPLAKEFSDLLPGIPIKVINDADAAALAESLVGAAKNTRSSVTLTLGTGVGSGIIIDGRLFSGGIGHLGGEIGHMVVKVGGKRCACGRYGCLETYASATAIKASTKECMDRLRRAGKESKLFEITERLGKVSARTPFIAMREGDKYGTILVERFLGYLSTAISNIINSLSPEIVIIGGGVSGEGEALIDLIKKRVNAELYPHGGETKTEIAVATLGSGSGVVGAAGITKALK